MYSANLYLSRYFRQTTRDDREAAELWLRYIYLYPGDIRGFRNVLINTRAEGASSAADKLRGWARAFAADSLTPRAMAELAVDLPYPRHRGHPRLAELRHEALQHLGLDATW